MKLAGLPAGYYSGGDYHKHCEIIKSDNDFKFCEDAIFWDHLDSSDHLTDRLMLVSCDSGRKAWNTIMGPLRDPEPHGGLWVHSQGQGKYSKPQRIRLEGYPQGHDFHPLGMEVYPSYNGNASNLFVVNHARERSHIEQFTLKPTNPPVATWIRTITSDYLVSPNSLVLTSPTSFYVTNDHLMTRRLPAPLGNILPMTETVLGLPFSWVSHITINDSAFSEPAMMEHTYAALGLSFANGIALSPDGETLAVASTSVSRIQFYARDPNTNKLTHTHMVPVPFAPDNIMFDDEGILIAAGHQHFPSLIGVAANKTSATAPSWVISITPREPQSDKGHPWEYDTKSPVPASTKVPAVLSHVVETLFQSNGELFSTSTTGLRDSRTGTLYSIGLYEEGLLVCSP